MVVVRNRKKKWKGRPEISRISDFEATTFKYKILGQFESLKIIKDLYAGWQSLQSSSFFPYKSVIFLT